MIEMDSTLVKMEDIKREEECCCCFSKEDLLSMLESYDYEENIEVYPNMIAACFQIELSSHVEECNRNLYFICKNCVFRLRDAITFRSEVRIAYERLEVEFCNMNKNGHVPIACSSNIPDTKENIIKRGHDNMECTGKFLTEKEWITDDIKQEDECCCCFSKEDLFSLLEPYNFEENVEVYLTMIAECFHIEFSSYVEEHKRNLYLICKNCVFRLRDAIMLRAEIQIAYDRLKAEHLMKDDLGVVSCENSDFIETKEHILKYEYDNIPYVNSGVLVKEENGLKLKTLKIVLKKIDDNTIKNVLIVPINSESDTMSQSLKIYVCNICNKLLGSLSALYKHQVRCKMCKYCDRTFKTTQNLLLHEKRHFNVKDYVCGCCKKAFTTNNSLIEHQKIHLDIKDFLCPYCKRPFRHKRSLREHILIHKGVKNVKCDLCDKFFVSKTAVSAHKRYSHSSFPCSICGRNLKTKRNLDYHMNVHAKDNRFICD